MAYEAYRTYIDLNMPVEVETRELGGRAFRLGGWLVEPSLNRLSHGDTTIQLELKVMDVLVCLAERAGEVVTRQEIVDRVWATEFISDNTLTHAITEIRNALGDDARNPSFIETIHRRGYRLIASFEPAVSDEATVSKVARFPVPERSAAAAEDRSPYPGLAAFTEADAEFFFGRENEVAQMWRKLTSRRLLAVIGPSGVGKSSFLRAGVIPAKPEGWGVLLCQPGEAPFAALARALVPEFAGDDDAISRLVHLSEPEETVAMISRWRDRHKQALLIVDQFEELFTLNPVEVQARFAALLRLLVDQADIHLLLSMRDDFLYRCQSLEPLHPVLDGLFALGQPGANALERALIEPARQLGFTFEDAQLAAEMVAEVEGERGALPLLAFAVACLWDKRDRVDNLLSRQAYADIGGVGGALGQHAESTLKGIGDQRLLIVREIFRNMVTSEGTRAVREWDEMLSVFAEDRRSDAEDVMRRLIDARLLTSFEEEAVEGGDHHRVEVVHETLLSSWPRLVRWQTQDADAAQLRDQLRQAARTWDEHDRTRDFLWTGRAYREFALWRGVYPGGLTDVEEDFSAAMTHHSKRRRRRRRTVAASFLVLAVVLAVVFGTLWRRSDLEARRAEAQKLLVLGQLELEGYPTATLAYARASLGLADTPEARLLALRALWEGAAARILELEGTYFRSVDMSPDGAHVAFSGNEANVLVCGRDGGPPRVLSDHATTVSLRTVEFGPEGGVLVTGLLIDPHPEAFVVYDVGTGAKVATAHSPETTFKVRGGRVFSVSYEIGESDGRLLNPILQTWPLGPGEPDLVGAIEGEIGSWDVDSTGSWFVYRRGSTLLARPVDGFDEASERVIGQFDSGDFGLLIHPRGDQVMTSRGFENETEFSFWALHGASGVPSRTFLGPRAGIFEFDADGGRLAYGSSTEKAVFIKDLTGPPDADFLSVRRKNAREISPPDFSADGGWLVTAQWMTGTFWWLGIPRPYVFSRPTGMETAGELEFSPGSDWLAFGGIGRQGVTLLPLNPDAGEMRSILWQGGEGWCYGMDFDAEGGRLLVAGESGPIVVFPFDGEPETRLMEVTWDDLDVMAAAGDVAFDPTGRYVAAAMSYSPNPDALRLRIWDLESGGVRAFPQWSGDERATNYHGEIYSLRFSPDGTLYSAGSGGVRRWNLVDGTDEVLLEANASRMDMSADGRLLLVGSAHEYWDTVSRLRVMDLETNEIREITSHGDQVWAFAIDPFGRFVATGSADGTVRVCPINGDDPHLLLGHDGPVGQVAISPDGQWIASDSGSEIRLWPMPDLSKPPLHTLPHDELIVKLKTLTNLRVVRDEESATGWKLEAGPFPGWETVPEW